MPRKKTKATEATTIEPTGGATAVAEPEPHAANRPAWATALEKPLKSATAVAERDEAPASRPAYIDGPPVKTDGTVITAGEDRPKNWGDPYKSIVTTPVFEMGENRRFRQRVFKFKEKPADDVIAALKDNGFTYRAAEKAWTITANPDTRKLSDELAAQFRGSSRGMEL